MTTSGAPQSDINLSAAERVFLLQTVAEIPPATLSITGAGVPFEWNSPPLSNDSDNWTVLPPVLPAVNPTDIRCNRNGPYNVRYSVIGSETGVAAAYIASYSDLDGVYLPQSAAQFDVGFNGAATWIMHFSLPFVAVGQILRLMFLSSPDVTIVVGDGAQFSITRMR